MPFGFAERIAHELQQVLELVLVISMIQYLFYLRHPFSIADYSRRGLLSTPRERLIVIRIKRFQFFDMKGRVNLAE
jgi:hypothetical protein